MRWAASDVSPSSHLAFHTPNTCRVLFVLCCVLGLGCLLLCGVFVSCFASVLESRILRAIQTSMTDKALSLARLCSKKKTSGSSTYECVGPLRTFHPLLTAFHLPNTCRVLFVLLCFGFGVFVALSCFCFLFCKCFGIPNSPRSLDLDDRQGLIASSAMQ